MKPRKIKHIACKIYLSHYNEPFHSFLRFSSKKKKKNEKKKTKNII